MTHIFPSAAHRLTWAPAGRGQGGLGPPEKMESMESYGNNLPTMFRLLGTIIEQDIFRKKTASFRNIQLAPRDYENLSQRRL